MYPASTDLLENERDSHGTPTDLIENKQKHCNQTGIYTLHHNIHIIIVIKIVIAILNIITLATQCSNQDHN